MPEDSSVVLDALDRAEDAFGGYTTGAPEYEESLDPEANQPPVIQLRKACRLLDACRTLREHDGYHTSVIEMSFAAIERTLEFYALSASNDSIDNFQNHTRAYDRAAALGVFSEQTARRLKTLYTDNRSAAYYRDTVATTEQAEMMFSLAVTIHDHMTNFSQQSYECRCDE
jgi:hypothetical protein